MKVEQVVRLTLALRAADAREDRIVEIVEQLDRAMTALKGGRAGRDRARACIRNASRLAMPIGYLVELTATGELILFPIAPVDIELTDVRPPADSGEA